MHKKEEETLNYWPLGIVSIDEKTKNLVLNYLSVRDGTRCQLNVSLGGGGATL